LVVLRDGRLASGGGDGQIKLWPKGGQSEPLILQHGSWIQSIVVLPDGRFASGGSDGQIKLWPKDGQGEPVVFHHGSEVYSLTVLRDGRLASVGRDDPIKLWLVEQNQLTSSLCLRPGRNLSRDEWVRYIGADVPWQPSCRDRPSNWRTPDSQK
jgi:phospholipase A-2-activating protein